MVAIIIRSSNAKPGLAGAAVVVVSVASAANKDIPVTQESVNKVIRFFMAQKFGRYYQEEYF
jgi:hypothetical protein